MEDFARFQDSQITRRAYLAETAELAYLGRSRGEWGLGLTDLARDQIVNAVGYRLIPLYRLIGPTAVIVILVMFIVGMARMLVDILVRAVIIARVRGWGFWMFGAIWDTTFQVAVSPFCWAVEKGKEGAGRIKNHMEARAAYAGVGHGGESPDNVEVLTYWAASWRRRVYGVVPSAELLLEARPGTAPPRVVGANLPEEGGGSPSINYVNIYSGKNTGPVRLLLQCSGGVCRGGCFLLHNRE
jgi:hypothetical protein